MRHRVSAMPESTESAVLTERRDNILIITINRPDKRNAVNKAVADGIGDAAELLYAEPVSGTVHSLHSRQGFDQGCPQAGPLFCFTYKAALDDVSAAFPDTLISAYYDDSPMVGQPLHVAEAYNYLLREDGPLRAANMRNHPSKTRVWSPVPLSDEDRAAFPAGTKFEEPEGRHHHVRVPHRLRRLHPPHAGRCRCRTVPCRRR